MLGHRIYASVIALLDQYPVLRYEDVVLPFNRFMGRASKRSVPPPAQNRILKSAGT